MHKQTGFTLIELMITIGLLITLGLIGIAVIVAIIAFLF